MSGLEIFLSIAGLFGVADLVRIIVEKLFSKKHDQVTTQRDEFAALRERCDYNEKELNRLNKNQITANRKISKMYSFLVRITPDTCTKKNCKYRELISIDFDDFDSDLDNVDVTPDDNGQQENV